jgi:NTE family protein
MRKIIFLLFLILPLIVLSQKKQPKVGLVLSGGGAKGFAHIGVLKELERAGVQVDYIAGTSMGAIIGGLYASGYSAAQIEKIIIETDFFTLLQDIYPRRSKPFFEKEHGEKHALVLPVNKGKIGLPKGVSRGQNVLGFLNYLLSPVDSISDFSKLPIPFFCIATDVETGLEVKLTNGSLPISLRASGSFPTLLDPVEIDNHLLIDGGVANNFPIEEMKKTGADIIIGVDVQSKLFNKEDIKSALDVLNQISSFQMYKDNSKKIKLTDVYVHPNIQNYSVVSFDKAKEILLKGEEKAKEFTAVFDSIASLQVNKRKHIEIGRLNSRFLLNEIELNGLKNYTRAYVLGKLKISEGDSLTNKEINLKLGYLLASGSFKNVDYHLRNNEKGKKLVLNIIENNQKSNIKIGVHYDFVYKSGVLLNYSHKNLFSKNDVLSFDFVVGDKPRYDIQYFVDNGFYYSYGFSTRYNSFKTDTEYNSTGINKINLQYTDFTSRAYIQTTFDRKFAFGIGLEHQNITAKTETISTPGGNPFIFDDSNYFNAYSYLKLDTYDNTDFPTKGMLLDVKFKWYLWSSNFNKDFVQFSQLKGKLGFVKTLFNNTAFLYTSEAGFTLGDVHSKTFDFLLGGYNKNFVNNFVPFYGYEINALSEQTFLKSEFEFRFGLPKEQYLHVIANYARVDDSVLNGGELFNDTKSGYALGYSVNTLIGPVSLKYSWSPDTKKNFWYFNLGFWF